MTPTPTPVPGVNWYYDVQMSAPLTAGAVWAVLLLFAFVMLVRPRQRTLQLFTLAVVVSFPLALINAGWWAFSLYFFTLLYMIISTLLRIAD